MSVTPAAPVVHFEDESAEETLQLTPGHSGSKPLILDVSGSGSVAASTSDANATGAGDGPRGEGWPGPGGGLSLEGLSLGEEEEDDDAEGLRGWYHVGQVLLGMTACFYTLLTPVRICFSYSVDLTYILDYAVDIVAVSALIPTLWEMWLTSLEFHDDRWRKAIAADSQCQSMRSSIVNPPPSGTTMGHKTESRSTTLMAESTSSELFSGGTQEADELAGRRSSMVLLQAADAMRRTQKPKKQKRQMWFKKRVTQDDTPMQIRTANPMSKTATLASIPDSAAEQDSWSADRANMQGSSGGSPRGKRMGTSDTVGASVQAVTRSAKAITSMAAIRFSQLFLVALRFLRRPENISMGAYISDFKAFLVNLFLMLCCMPWDLVLLVVLGIENAYPTVPLWRLTRLAVAIRLQTYLRMLALNQSFGYTTTKILKIALWSWLAAHSMACMFFLASRLGYCGGNHEDVLEDRLIRVLYSSNGGMAPICGHYKTAVWAEISPGVGWTEVSADEIPTAQLYLRSLYWAFMTLTTVGHVDKIDHGTQGEFCFAIFLMLLSTIVYAYTLAEMTSLLIAQDAQIERYRQKLTSVERYLSKRKIDTQTRELVRVHFKSAYENEDDNDDEILGHMPRALRARVLQSANLKLLRDSPFTQGLDAAAVDALAAAMGRTVFMQDEVLCAQGTVPLEVFVLEDGRLAKDKDGHVRESRSSRGSESSRSSSNNEDRFALPVGYALSSDDDRISAYSDSETEGSLHGASLHGGSMNGRGSVGAAPLPQNGINPSKGDHHDASATVSIVGVSAKMSAVAAMAKNLQKRSRRKRAKHKGSAVVVEEPGSSLCEAAFVFGVRNPYSVVAHTRSTVLSLKRADFTAVMSEFQGDLAVLRQNLLRSVKDNDDRAFRQKIEDVQRMKEESTVTEMCFAAGQGDVKRVLVLASEIHVDTGDYDGRTAMHIAASEGHAHVVKALLDQGAHVNVKDRWGGTPLRDALQGGYMELAAMLHRHHAKLLMGEVDMAAKLCDMAKSGELELMRIYLKCGADPNATDYDKRTAMHVACSEGNRAIINALLDHGARKNMFDRFGNTPLYDALRHGHCNLAEELARNEYELMQAEAEIAGKLCDAAKAGELALLRSFLACRADVNSADYDKRTCIHIAASEGNTVVVGYLLDHGSHVNPIDRFGNTPLHDCIRQRHHATADLLRRRGGLINFAQPGKDGHGQPEGFIYEQDFTYPGNVALNILIRDLRGSCKWSAAEAETIAAAMEAWDEVMTTVGDMRALSQESWDKLSAFVKRRVNTEHKRLWGPRREDLCRERVYATTFVVDQSKVGDRLTSVVLHSSPEGCPAPAPMADLFAA